MNLLIKEMPTQVGIGYGEFVRTLFRPLPPQAMLAHAAMGVMTEYQEWRTAPNEINAIEEAGDFAFFCVAFQQSLPHQVEVDLGNPPPKLKEALDKVATARRAAKPGEQAEAMLALLFDMLDAAKRWLAYDKAPDEEACAYLAHAAEAAAAWLLPTHSTAEDAITANAAKLLKRYPAGFSTASAVNRDVGAEIQAVRSQVAPSAGHH